MEDNSGSRTEEGPQDHEMKDSIQTQGEQCRTSQVTSAADLAARDQALALQARLVERQRAKVATAAAEADLGSDAEVTVKLERPAEVRCDGASHEHGTSDQIDGRAETDAEEQVEAQGEGQAVEQDVTMLDSHHSSTRTDRHDSRVCDHVEAQMASRFEEYLLPSGGSEQVEILKSARHAQENDSHDSESRRAAADLLGLRNGRLQTSAEAHEEPSPGVIDLTTTSDDAADSDQPTRRRAYHHMYLADLQKLCRQRGLNRNGAKALLVDRLRADDDGGEPQNSRARRFNARRQAPASSKSSFPAQHPAGMSHEQVQMLRKQQMLNQQRAIAMHLGGPHQPAHFRQQVMQSEADVNPAMARAIDAHYQAMLGQMRRQNAPPQQRGAGPSWPNGERLQGPEQRHLAPGYWREQNRLFVPDHGQSSRSPASQRRQALRRTSPPPLVPPTFPNRTLPKPGPSQDSHPPGYTFYAAMPASFGGLDLARCANGREKGYGEAAPSNGEDRSRNEVDRWKERHMQQWDSRGTVTNGSGDGHADSIPDLVLDEDDAVKMDEHANV